MNAPRPFAALMRRLACLTAGLALAACAATGPGPASAAEAAAPAQGPALWVVQDEDTTLYLFGTIHVLRPGDDWGAPHVDEALAASGALWLELSDMDDSLAAAAGLRRYGFAPQGPALSSLLTETERTRLAEVAGAMNMPLEGFEPMQPWLAAVQIGMAAAMRAGYDPASGVDLRLKAEADARGLPVRGFETTEQQFRFLHDLPRETQLQFLGQSLETYAEADEVLDSMVQLWAKGDTDGFQRLVVDEARREWPALYDVLLVRRNADWAEQIETLLQEPGTVFIAVGAAHLVGDDSVQSMLEARGIQARRR